MDDGSYNGGKQSQQQQQAGGGYGQKGDNGDGGGGGGNKVKYTMPGVLHFIQHEWSNFELERSHWEIDRAELQASFARDARPLFADSCPVGLPAELPGSFLLKSGTTCFGFRMKWDAKSQAKPTFLLQRL